MSTWKKMYNSYVSISGIKDAMQEAYANAHEDTDEEVINAEIDLTEDVQTQNLENSDNFEKEAVGFDNEDEREAATLNLVEGKVFKDKFKNSDDIDNNNRPTKEERKKQKMEELENKLGNYF